jgi:hypothetical protein
MRIHLPRGVNHDNTKGPVDLLVVKFLFDKASINRAIIRIARRVLFAN